MASGSLDETASVDAGGEAARREPRCVSRCSLLAAESWLQATNDVQMAATAAEGNRMRCSLSAARAEKRATQRARKGAGGAWRH